MNPAPQSDAQGIHQDSSTHARVQRRRGQAAIAAGYYNKINFYGTTQDLTILHDSPEYPFFTPPNAGEVYHPSVLVVCLHRGHLQARFQFLAGVLRVAVTTLRPSCSQRVLHNLPLL